jgi:sensor histidine kinase regulating citrate/malate metabolism
MILLGGKPMDNTYSPKDKKEFYKTKHFRFMLVIVFLLVIAFSATIIVSTLLFNRSTREYREEIIKKTAILAAEQIDADHIDKWLGSGIDDSYIQTEKLLQSICNHTPYLQYLYVYQIKPDGCHVVFDIETMEAGLDQYDELPEEAVSHLGEIIEFDKSFSEEIPTLLEGRQIDIKESNDKYGWLLTKYEPIIDLNGRCVAYVGADISMIGVNDYNHTFFRWIVAISVLFFLLLFIAAYHYILVHKKLTNMMSPNAGECSNRHCLN